MSSNLRLIAQQFERQEARKKSDDYPDDWDVVEETQDPDAAWPSTDEWAPFETVAESQQDDHDTAKAVTEITVEEVLSEGLASMTVAEVPTPAPPATKKRKPTAKKKTARSKKVSAKAKKTQTRTTSKPQRQKSAGTIAEKAYKKGKGYCSVVCRLETICRDSLLCEEIKRSAHAMKQIQLEAWHLVNLHSLRCLENDLPLPDYADKTFFDHCCAGVASTNKSHEIAQKNPELWNSIKIYQSNRERVGLSEVKHLTGYSELKLELREQMVVNAGVMIREHFRKRLKLYVDVSFGGLGQTLTKKQRKEKEELVKQIMRSCYSVDETGVAEALQMRKMLTPEGTEWSDLWISWPNRIKENSMAFYVRLIWKFQGVVEKRMEDFPNEKGIRAFALFPVSTTYSRAHIKINGSTLAGFYSRIKLRVKDYNGYVPSIPLSVTSYKQNRWAVMRNAFDIARFETRRPECPLSKPDFMNLSVEEKYEHAGHLFANQVTTDGYGASVLLFRPKTEDEKSENKKSTDGPVVPAGYVPDVVIGLDPGMRSVCTAVREDFRPSGHQRHRRRRQRQPRRAGRKRGSQKKKKANRPRWIRRPKPPRQRNDRDIVSVTTREYRHMAGFNRFRSWNEGQRKQFPEYQAVIADMPSFKTASYDTYLKRLEYFWKHVRYLMQFCADRPFLKWKFFQKRMARVAVDEIARRIVPTVSRKTCVAYGDWSRRKGIKGHALSPVKGLKQALQKRATVVSMDEFRTSKLCSQCHQTLSMVRYTIDTKLPKRRKRKGVVLTRNRAEIQFEEKKCYGVLRCDHSDCEACYWDRDVNAAINMVNLLKSEVLGRGRMEPFRR